MNRRTNRIPVLRMILSNQALGSLEEIMKELAKHGCSVSQGTLSIDLRKLQIAKIHTPEGPRYVLPDSPYYRRNIDNSVVEQISRSSGFRKISFSGNLCVIHTRPGYANAIASDIDALSLPPVIGSIAGEDTILLILAEGTRKEEVIDQLSEMIPAVGM